MNHNDKNMTTTNWKLLNAEMLQRRYPGRFLRPSNEKLLRMLVRDRFVKMVFQSSNNKPGFIGIEYLWVRLIGYKDGMYNGRLVNQPEVIQTLQKGSIIQFRPENVAEFGFPQIQSRA